MQQEDSDEEDKIQHTARSSSVQAQRLPIFPGMDHSVLKVNTGRTHEMRVKVVQYLQMLSMKRTRKFC